MPDIVIIGSGNVAHHLGLGLKNNGCTIRQVYSRQMENAGVLAKILECDATDNIAEIRKDADIYLFAVKDDLIASLAKRLTLDNPIVVHTSGSVDMEVLRQASTNIGVFYPLQTFTAETSIDLAEVPLLIEGNTEYARATLKDMALMISKQVLFVTSDQRQQVHLAAVFVNNFVNHLVNVAYDIMERAEMDGKLLLPLLKETVAKVNKAKPSDIQTGPAIRGDKGTIQRHLDLLRQYGLYHDLYKSLTESIQSKQP